MDSFQHAWQWFISIDWKPEAVTAAATIVLALLTLVLAAGTIALWAATRKLVRDGKDTAQRQLRAYVGLQRGYIIIIGNEYRIVAEFKNWGQTPGYKLRTYTNATIAGDGDPLPFDDPGVLPLSDPNSVIGPDAASFSILHRFFEGDSLDRIIMRASAFCVWGRVDYEDAFGHPRYFTFRCTAAGPQETIMIGDTEMGEGWAFSAHPLGYTAN